MRPLKVNRLPLSLQAQRYLRHAIENGTYQPGERLPSEANLAAELGISRGTLREALLNLEQEGMIVRKHGVGTFVAPGCEHRLESGLERLESILELAARRGLQTKFDALQVREEPAGAELADRLQATPGTLVTSVRRVIVVDRVPVAYMCDVVLTSILPSAAVDESFNGSVLDLLKHKREQPIAQAMADIVALNADASLAGKLGVEPGQAVLLIEETMFDKRGTPIGFSENYFVPDFFRFRVVRG
jgi:GntR family transcriptional regulator